MSIEHFTRLKLGIVHFLFFQTIRFLGCPIGAISKVRQVFVQAAHPIAKYLPCLGCRLYKRAKKQPSQMCKFGKRISVLLLMSHCVLVKLFLLLSSLQIAHFYASPSVSQLRRGSFVQCYCTASALWPWRSPIVAWGGRL